MFLGCTVTVDNKVFGASCLDFLSVHFLDKLYKLCKFKSLEEKHKKEYDELTDMKSKAQDIFYIK